MQLRKFAALGLAVIAPMSLSGCLLLPGEFNSEMTLMKSGEFSFSYKGQIQLVGLANMLNNELDGGMGETEFVASCYGPEPEGEKSEADTKKEKRKQKAMEKAAEDAATAEAALAEIGGADPGTAASKTAQEESGDEAVAADEAVDAAEAAGAAADAAAEAVDAIDESGEFEERECTAAETEQQKKEWDEQQVAKKKEKEQAKKMFAMLLGGIDPEDPKTITRFTKEVERLASWHKVEHQGNGVFLVDYSTKGRLADDFAFPVIPRYALGNPMIHITRWDNGRVRVEAPTFHNDADVSLMAMMGSGSMIPGMSAGAGKKQVEPVEVKGSFVIRTDARILANNTDEGPSGEGGMDVLRWDIGPKTFGPPMALLKLAN